MFNHGRRLLVVALGWAASLRGAAPMQIPAGDPMRPPTAPPASKTRQLSNPGRVRGTFGDTWLSRFKAFRRRWSPPGGGGKECARRREQIRKGMLGRCNDVKWSESTLAVQEANRVAQAQRSFIAVDRGSPTGDVTAIARAHSEPGGKVVIDDIIEFQPAGRDPSP